jgi:3-hydroxyisobutyrate dehydrogenase
VTGKRKVGFIGLGSVCNAMSLRLLEKGWALNVWNLEPERVAAGAAAGATEMDSPAAVTRAQMAKMINQAIVWTTYVLMAEALMLAEASGIDAAKLPQCLAGGHADGSLLQQLYPRMQARAFEPPLAYARQLLKDMRAVQSEIRAGRLALPVIEQAIGRHQAYVAQGNEMADPASIVGLYEQRPPTSEKTGRM